MKYYCSHCGTNTEDGTAKFCTSCGNIINTPPQMNTQRAENIANDAITSLPHDDMLEKDIKKVKSAGLSAQALGWGFAIIPILIELISFGETNNYATLAVYLLVILPLSALLIYSGNSIKTFKKSIRKWLIFNIILSILAIGGLLPSLVLINSISGYSASKRLLSKNRDRQPEQKSNNLIVNLSLLVIIAVVSVVVHYASVESHYKTSANRDVVYTSQESNFSVTLPHNPEIDTRSVDVEGYNVPFRTYYSNTTEAEYIAIIYDYSSLPEFDAINGLAEGLEGMAQIESGGKVISSNASTYQGYPSIRGELSIPGDNTFVDASVWGFVKDRDMYILMMTGGDSSSFQSFQDSFNLL